MTLHISINGRDITEYGITPLDGILNVLVKPAGLKKIKKNTNDAFDGVMPVVNAHRKRDSRTITLNFYLRSQSLIDRDRDIERLEAALIAGKSGGVNELYVAELDKCYRLIYDGVSSIKTVVNDRAIIGLKFLEHCPTAENRVP